MNPRVTISAGVALVAANFICQLVRDTPNWDTAIERSWFQITAVAIVALMHWVARRDA